MVIIMARIVYIGIKTGFIIEFFKLAGILLAVFLLLHYYSSLAVIVPDRVPISKAGAQIFFFVLLWSAITFVFRLIREGVLLLFSVEANKKIDQWGGGILAVVRGLVICSLTLFLLLLAKSHYIEKLVKTSIAQRCVLNISVGIYTAVHNGFVSKFFPDEKINEEALAVVKTIKVKRKLVH